MENNSGDIIAFRISGLRKTSYNGLYLIKNGENKSEASSRRSYRHERMLRHLHWYVEASHDSTEASHSSTLVHASRFHITGTAPEHRLHLRMHIPGCTEYVWEASVAGSCDPISVQPLLLSQRRDVDYIAHRLRAWKFGAIKRFILKARWTKVPAKTRYLKLEQALRAVLTFEEHGKPSNLAEVLRLPKCEVATVFKPQLGLPQSCVSFDEVKRKLENAMRTVAGVCIDVVVTSIAGAPVCQIRSMSKMLGIELRDEICNLTNASVDEVCLLVGDVELPLKERIAMHDRTDNGVLLVTFVRIDTVAKERSLREEYVQRLLLAFPAVPLHATGHLHADLVARRNSFFSRLETELRKIKEPHALWQKMNQLEEMLEERAKGLFRASGILAKDVIAFTDTMRHELSIKRCSSS